MATTPLHRVARIRDVLATPQGHVRLAVCTRCDHQSPLPVGGLLRRHTAFTPLRQALDALRCPACGEHGTIEAVLSKVDVRKA